MNVRRRQDAGNREVGMPPKNAATKRRDGDTQAKKIPNTISSPSPQGVAGIRGAVNNPKP